MTHLSTSDLRKHTADAVNRVAFAGERIIIDRSGKPVAALISIEDLELLQALEDRADLEEIRQARKEVAKKGTVPWEKAKEGADR